MLQLQDGRISLGIYYVYSEYKGMCQKETKEVLSCRSPENYPELTSVQDFIIFPQLKIVA